MEGGAANASWHLAREVAARGHRVSVLTAAWPGGVREPRAGEADIAEVAVPGHTGGAFTATRLAVFGWRARGLQRKLPRPDLVHAFFSLPAGWVARHAGAPYVVSLRGSDVPGFRHARGSLPFLAVRPCLRRVWREAGAVVANSPELRALAAQSWNGRIEVIPNGVDTRRFAPRGAGGEAAGGAVRILMVNQLVPRKRVAVMLEAWPAICAGAGVPLELRIVGRGVEEAALRARAEGWGAVSAPVLWEGAIPPSDMPDCYRSSDIFVLLSERDGMSNALLEAMASGLACCVSAGANAGGAVEHGVSGVVVDPDDPGWWRNLSAIARFAEERRRLGAAARARVEAHFGWAAVADRYIEIYRRVVSAGPGCHV